MAHSTPLSEATARVNAKIRFYSHLAVYVLVNALLVIINLTTSTKHLWCLWPLVGWGIGLLAHALGYFLRWRGPNVRASMIERELRKTNIGAPSPS